MKLTKINTPLIFGRHAWTAVLLFAVFIFPLIINPNISKRANPQVLSAEDRVLARGQEVPVDPNPVPTKIGEINLSQFSAQSLLAYDERTGAVLVQKEPTLALGIASLTKLLTGLVVYENLDMNSYVTITSRDILEVSPALHLRVGDQIKVYDLFNSMLIGSCNDAALALANHTASQTGIRFEELMNRKAQDLQMNSSHFSNPMGFDSSGNFSTAEDIKRLVDKTREYEVFGLEGRQESYGFASTGGHDYRTVASNKLIKLDPEITSIKTGYTNQTGGSMVTKATRDNNSVIMIVLNSGDREADTQNLKAQIYRNFTWILPPKSN